MKLKNENLTPAAIAAFNKLMANSDQLPLLTVWELSDVAKKMKEQHTSLIGFLKELGKKYPEEGPDKEAEFKSLLEKEFEIPMKGKMVLPDTFTGLGINDVDALSFIISRKPEPEVKK
jgi:hypothetical protein